MNPVRFALAGFGAWGQLHAQAIAKNPLARLVAVTAPSEASRLEASKLHPEARIYQDALSMIAAGGFDLIDIVTPSHTHREIAVAALAKGFHVLLEKPMATSIADCRAISVAANQAPGRLAVGNELRLSSQWATIKSLVRQGVIGRPQYALVELLRKPYRLGASGWRYDPARVGSWVLEEPIHFFDLAHWYLEDSGMPVQVYARGNSKDPARLGLYDNFSSMFHYADGSYAVVSQTLAAFEHHQTVKVAGTKGAIWAGWSGAMDRTLEPTAFLRVFDGEKLEEVSLSRQSGEVFELHEEIDQCVRMARGEPFTLARAEDGLLSAGLCLISEESIRESRPIEVGDLLRV